MGEGVHTKGVARRITERGYTDKMARNITGTEARIRNNRDESLHFFDSKGNLMHVTQGKGAGVSDDGYRPPKDSILTHNHPRAIGKTGLESIGNSFSWQDVRTAILSDAKEMRAVTPTYTFSVKRPKGGWGTTAKDFVETYKATEKAISVKLSSYLRKYKGDYEVAAERASALHYHLIMKELKKKYGWTYTKTKG